MRSYGQYCPIAAALDVIGERWSLLIIRELSFGPRRFSQIRKALPGLSPNLLIDRLRVLVEQEIIERREDAGMGVRATYLLTTSGSDLLPILQSLAQWGIHHLPDPSEVAELSPVSAIRTALFTGVAYKRLPPEGLRVSLEIDSMLFRMLINGPVPWLRSGRDPKADVFIKISAVDLVRWRQGRLRIGESLRTGRVELSGNKIESFLDAFGLQAASATRPEFALQSLSSPGPSAN